tara:strand:- start:2495 stop:3064 length:570 start_codon:yes stop_codon:yes gene_type:complete
VKITKRHIQQLKENYQTITEKQYDNWMYDYPQDNFSFPDFKKKTFKMQHPTWKPDYKTKIAVDKNNFTIPQDDFVNNKKLTLPHRDVGKYQWDARGKKQFDSEKRWGSPEPLYGGANIIQVDRPEGKRFYGKIDKSEFGQPDDWLNIDSRATAEYTPADSLTTQQVIDFDKKYNLGLDDKGWFDHTKNK